MGRIAIIGSGPAGLIAAETLAQRGHNITVYDHMPSPGRKFLLAGRGGLNLTHSEALKPFLTRYGEAAAWLAPCIEAFTPDDLRAWCEGLGQNVFVGTSGRVFPKAFKGAPLLRAWLQRLEALDVQFAARHRWLGFSQDGGLRFANPLGEIDIKPDATLLALGGVSWPRMGSDGKWVSILREAGVAVADLRPSNCGVKIAWSEVFSSRFEGHPLKRIAVTAGDQTVRGEALVTKEGLEGGAIYAVSARLRDALASGGPPTSLFIDLLPDIAGTILAKLDGLRQGRSIGNFLRQTAGLSPIGIGLVQEALHCGFGDAKLSRLVKAIPLSVTGMQPIGRAISSAGGIRRSALNDSLMLMEIPGVFVAGEMLDWEAPTGGYLLQACFSTGVAAANGIAKSVLF